MASPGQKKDRVATLWHFLTLTLNVHNVVKRGLAKTLV